MSNDLISRSEVLKALEHVFDKYRMSWDREKYGGFGREVPEAIRNLPTAYDVDKVVKLEKENAEMKEVIRKLLCSEYGSSCQFCIQDNNDNAMCRKVGGSGSWCCENAAYDREWNKR